jgi:hypothetical protein
MQIKLATAAIVAEPPTQSDEKLLDRFQREAFGYFTKQFNPANGLVTDSGRPGSTASIAVVGFALSCHLVEVERGWMARADAAPSPSMKAITVLVGWAFSAPTAQARP